jgi:predicted transcriptional regulator of viral defense system
MNYHGFTDQTPRKIFVTTTANPPKYQASEKKNRPHIETGYPVMNIFYQFIKTNPKRFFGHTKVWIGDSKITLTDKERTLIDGLLAPEHCGGFQEVLSCFQRAIGSIDFKKLIDYSLKLDLVIPKRLGWILENLKVSQNEEIEKLKSSAMPSVGLLNPTGDRKGSVNKRWNLIENIYGEPTS